MICWALGEGKLWQCTILRECQHDYMIEYKSELGIEYQWDRDALCDRWLIHQVELSLFRIAAMTSQVEKGVAVVLSGCVIRRHLLTQRASGFKERSFMEVNCLLKEDAIS